MISQNMQIQAIPLWVILVLYLINLCRKRSFFCISSLVFLYSSLTLLGAVFLHLRPRTGVESYANLDAMLFLSLCSGILHIPLLFIKDGKIICKEVVLSSKHFIWISNFLLLFGVPISIYLLIKGLPNIIDFSSGNFTRAEIRDTIDDTPIRSAPFIMFQWIFGITFNFCSLFMFIYGIKHFKTMRLRNYLLFFSGLSLFFHGLHTISRQHMSTAMMYIVCCACIIFKEIRYLKTIFIFIAFLIFPFILISIIRFSDTEGLLYTFYSYFSQGAYGFNAIYTARTEFNVPPMNGYGTSPALLFLWDKFFHSGHYESAKQLLADYMDGIEVFQNIDGSYSGEFRTAVGTFVADYHPVVVILLFIILSLVFIKIFSRKFFTPSMMFAISIYSFLVLTGAFGYPWGSGMTGLFLYSNILFFFLLSFIEKSKDSAL